MKFQVTIAMGNGTTTRKEIVEAKNAQEARMVAEARTGGKATGCQQK